MSTSRPPLLNTTLRWFLAAMVLANIAGEMVFTVLALYLASLGASVGQIGLVYSLAALVPLALQIVGGWLSDTIGRLRTIAIGSAVATLGYLGMFLAPSWEWVLVSLALEYVSGSMVGPSFAAFIADESSDAQRGRVYGVTRGIFLVVGVIGPPLGGLLVDRHGYRLVMGIAMILYASATLLRLWMATSERFAPGKPAGQLTLSGLRTRLASILALLVAGGVLTWILITDGVSDSAYLLSQELRPLYLSKVGGLSVTQIGLLGSLMSITTMLVSAPTGWLSDRYGERVAITAGFLLASSALYVFLNASAFPGFALAAIVLGAGFGAIGPAYDSLVSKVTPENLRGLAFGFFQTSLGVVSLPAPWIGAQLWERFGPKAPFTITAAMALLAGALAWTKFKLPPGTTGEEHPATDAIDEGEEVAHKPDRS